MKVFDTTYLESEAGPPPVSALRRVLRVLVWSFAVAGGAGILVFVALHIAPAAGAAGGCGGG